MSDDLTRCSCFGSLTKRISSYRPKLEEPKVRWTRWTSVHACLHQLVARCASWYDDEAAGHETHDGVRRCGRHASWAPSRAAGRSARPANVCRRGAPPPPRPAPPRLDRFRPPAGAYCRPAAMSDGSTQKWMLLDVHYPSLRPRPPPAPLHPYPTDFYCFYYSKIINQATDYTTREACKQ